MTNEQRSVGGKTSRDRPPADSAPTQIAGGEEAGFSPSRTIPSESVGLPAPDGAVRATWPPPQRSPFSATPEPAEAPPEMAGSETVVMEPEPKAPIPLAWLAVVEGPGGKRGKIVALKAETVVGRTQGDLTLNGDHAVSSQHIRIRLEPQEQQQIFVLYDLASTNGTYAGTRETYRDEASRTYRRELKDGDYVLLGETTLVFKQIE